MTEIFAYISENQIEFWAALTALICVWLAAVENVWNWPVSIVSTLLYALVFYRSRLYSDALLQLVFIAFQIFGWWQWAKKINNEREHNKSGHIKIHAISGKKRFLFVLMMLVFGILWYFFLIRMRPDVSLPAIDTAILSISIFAIILQAQKAIENWILWLICDLISVPVYMYKQLWFTAVVYALFLIIAVYGYRSWLRIMHEKS